MAFCIGVSRASTIEDRASYINQLRESSQLEAQLRPLFDRELR
jgi:hypothetical protein